MNKYKVSIIVPIYNGEKYIEKCAVSLFEQDFEDIEYVFVNDCTPDNSVEILEKVIEKYPHRKPHCKIIHHKENKGLGGARNIGLKNATGYYILHIDQDDWCELDMISLLYNKAIETDADIVACDFYLSYKDRKVYKKEEYSNDLFENQQNLWRGKLHPANWNKLVKTSLYFDNNIYPSEKNNITEDYFLTSRLFIVAEKIAYIPKALYNYWQDNDNSICNSIARDKSLVELRWAFDFLSNFLREKGLFEIYKEAFYQKTFGYILWVCNWEYDKKIISKTFPELEGIKYIWRKDMRFRSKIKFSLQRLHLGFIANIFLRIKND
ncbi:MAG: glycosyltransferase family 2 protein [Flavobacteriaceae bacterium]|nr:glycosyltransferase family 2 protein [Flavobacteriaceae bacterium]